MRDRSWQQRQKKQQQAQQRRQQQGYSWQQQQMRQQQAQRQISPSKWQPQRPPVTETPDWDYTGDWEDDGGVLGFFKTVLKLVVVGAILFLVLRAIF